jgi:hypothetical protein
MSTWETYQAGSTVRIRRRPVRYRVAKAAPEPAPAEPDYSSMKKDELVAEAEELGLDTTGTKSELIERLS